MVSIEMQTILDSLRSNLKTAMKQFDNATAELVNIIEGCADENETLRASNEELKNKLWAAERRYHQFDEWEREPEDA